MKQLVIAEKPSAARDMARVLHCTQKSQGALEAYMEGQRCVGRKMSGTQESARGGTYAG